MNTEQLLKEGGDHIERQNWQSAVECFQIVLNEHPGYYRAEVNLAIALNNLGLFAEAAPLFESSRDKFDCPMINSNLGICYNCLTLYPQAEAAFRRVLAEQPNNANMHYQLHYALLGQGKYLEGWQENAWRRKTPMWDDRGSFPNVPLWRGESVPHDRTLCIMQEQGLGDTLMMLRFFPAIRENVKNVFFVGAPSLSELVETNFGIPAYGKRSGAPGCDVQCTIFDLPGIFGVTPQTIPPSPYLTVSPQKVVRWRERLAALPDQPTIGLVWAGNSDRHARQIEHDNRRSFPFDYYRPLFDAVADRVNFVALQTGDQIWQSRTSDLPIVDWVDDMTSFAETAALMVNLDLLITADTAPLHLAGALGIPFWVPQRFDACWRFQHTPWYNTMREFRQETWGDWAAVMDRISSSLIEWRSQYHSRSPASYPAKC